MTSRPPFSLDGFIRARFTFDYGRGPVDSWARITEISLWRVDELAEQVGSRAWALIFGPQNGPTDREGVPRHLDHAVRSAGLGGLSVLAYWRLRTGLVSVSRVRVIFEIDAQRTARMAHRYAQVAAVHIQRIPFEEVVVLSISDAQRVLVGPYQPSVIADAVAGVVGADALAVEHLPTSWFEALVMGNAERRRGNREPL